MSTVAFIRRCLESGMDMATALTAAEAFEATVPDATPKAETLTPGAARMRRYRERKASQSVTRDNAVTEVSESESVTKRHGDEDHPPPPPSPRTPHPPTPTRDGNTTREGLFAEPEEPKPKRGSRMREDWEPSAKDWQRAREAGLDDGEIRDEVIQFRNYWIAEPGRDGLKSDWGRTWHNRVIAVGKRKREKLARQAVPRAGGRGSWGLGEHLAWQRAQGGDRTPLPD